ncbi:MAG: PIN domain-containing protein [Afipia felis]|nr:PIN domain-containing protein [Afipia felis]
MTAESPVVYDANILFSFHVSHVLTFMAVRRLVNAKWTEKIQREWLENFTKKYPDDVEGCRRRCDAMNRALPSAMVTGYEHLIDKIAFKDPDDRHVIAAALHSNAIGIVTLDGHFTSDSLKPFGLRVIDPDDLLVECADQFPGDCVKVLEQSRLALTISNPTHGQYLDILESRGLTKFADRIRALNPALAPNLP